MVEYSDGKGSSSGRSFSSGGGRSFSSGSKNTSSKPNGGTYKPSSATKSNTPNIKTTSYKPIVVSPKMASKGITATPAKFDYHPTTSYTRLQTVPFSYGGSAYRTNNDWMFWYLMYNSSKPRTVYVTSVSPTNPKSYVTTTAFERNTNCFVCHGRTQATCGDCHYKHVAGKEAPKSKVDFLPTEAKDIMNEESGVKEL